MNARGSLGRIVRDVADGKMAEETGRVLGYLLGQMLGFFKAEREDELADRLAAVEDKLGALLK